ncbi:peptidase [Cytophagales bacterium RKSG123]|nr:peptidase [Xanthovirga aplysinae]
MSKIAFLFLALAIFVSACQETDHEIAPVDETLVSPEVSAQFASLGFNPIDIEKVGENYLVGGDIIVTPKALENMKEAIVVGGPSGEQYRTYNLVSAPRVITVKGRSLSSTVSNALNLAIANYNNENLGITFQRVSRGRADITLRETGSSAGGVAGFPEGDGDPYPSITIYGGTSSYGLDVVKHVITHELGHCIGLRHTDWFDRSFSCSPPYDGVEAANPEGAVHIPGTNQSFDANSVMNSCFNSASTGVFSAGDKTALDYLY